MNTKIRIDRTKWDRCPFKLDKEEHWNSALYVNEREAGCCLGHCVSQLANVPLELLDGIGMPSESSVANHPSLEPFVKKYTVDHAYGFFSSDFASDASEINDDWSTTDLEKEEKLIKLFKDNGFDLEFYN